MSRTRAIMLAVVIIVILAGAGVLLLASGNGSDEGTTELAAGDAPAPTAANTECETWAMPGLDHTGNRVIATGVEAINTASTPEEARAAAVEYVGVVKTDAQVMAGNAMIMLDREIEWASLVDEDGCATAEAEVLASQMEAAVMFAPEVIPENAPASGTNTGVDAEGNLVQSATPGVHGYTKAVKVVLDNGTVFWVMARCGNLVTVGSPGLPPGPTDNPPPPGTTVPPSTTTPPTTTRGKYVEDAPAGVVPDEVTPEPPVRQPAPNPTTPPATAAPRPETPVTTVAPNKPVAPSCPGGNCTENPSPPTTEKPPAPKPTTTVPRGTLPPPPPSS